MPTHHWFDIGYVHPDLSTKADFPEAHLPCTLKCKKVYKYSVHLSKHVYACVYVRMYVCTYVRVYTCTYVHMCMNVCTLVFLRETLIHISPTSHIHTIDHTVLHTTNYCEQNMNTHVTATHCESMGTWVHTYVHTYTLGMYGCGLSELTHCFWTVYLTVTSEKRIENTHIRMAYTMYVHAHVRMYVCASMHMMWGKSFRKLRSTKSLFKVCMYVYIRKYTCSIQVHTYT